MACEIINGITTSCDYSISGVEKLWLANKADVATITYNTDSEVTGITMTTGSTFYEYQSSLDSITYQDDLVVNGSRRNFLHTINFALNSLTSAQIETLETLGQSNVVAIIKTSEGIYKILGNAGSGLRVTVMTETSGTNSGNDGNIGVTISGSNRTKSRIVDQSVITTLGL